MKLIKLLRGYNLSPRAVMLAVFTAVAMAPALVHAQAADVSTLTDAAVQAIQGKGGPTVTIFQAVIVFAALIAIGALIVGLLKRR